MITSIFNQFPSLSPLQKEQLEALLPLYEEWNQRINVISRADMAHFYTRHVLHSLGVAKVEPFAEHAKILDVGTGGGFPGIPLAILFPKTHFTLVDSIGKKIKSELLSQKENFVKGAGNKKIKSSDASKLF